MAFRLPKQLFLFSTVACVLLRIYLHMTQIDSSTGFYEPENFLVTLQNILLLLSVAGLFFLPMLGKDSSACEVKATGFLRVAAVICGITAFFPTIPVFRELFYDFLYFRISNLPGILYLLLGYVLLPIISGILFIYIGLKGKDTLQDLHINGYLLLVPVIWQALVLLNHFMRYTASRSISDQMLCIVALIFSVPFLLAHGRMGAGLDLRKGTKQLVTYGLSFALVALTAVAGILSSLPSLGDGVLLAFSLPESLFYFALGLYAVALSFSLEEIS